jgi:hypothetical protein
MKHHTLLFSACLAVLLVQPAMAQSAMTQQPAASSASATAKSSAAAGQVQEACADDFKKLCPDAQPGETAMHNCLKQHSKELSSGCKQAVKAAHKGHQSQAPKNQ